MPIPETLVAEVVSEVSQRMSDPSYAQVAIGGFVQAHPDVSRFITAHLDELGGGEAVMYSVFHAEVMHECFRRHTKADLPSIRFPDLDAAATPDDVALLRALQPALADYLASNVETEPMRKLLSLVALAMTRAAR
jgi:hypothetical protein